MMVSFTDEQLAAIMQAATPLTPSDRSNFLRDVANALQGRCDLGPGITYKIVSEIQRRYHPSS